MSVSVFDTLALLIPCHACKAEPGEWCRTFRPTRRSAGVRASWLHTARLHPIYDAYGEGYQDAERHAAQAAEPDQMETT